ncbi:unnamed protein product [Amoebophrya sp. A25]|nr:unnamed protein product [Amoebophrya sp. A25]|eukprot:GSA25T00022287001.1
MDQRERMLSCLPDDAGELEALGLALPRTSTAETSTCTTSGSSGSSAIASSSSSASSTATSTSTSTSSTFSGRIPNFRMNVGSCGGLDGADTYTSRTCGSRAGAASSSSSSSLLNVPSSAPLRVRVPEKFVKMLRKRRMKGLSVKNVEPPLLSVVKLPKLPVAQAQSNAARIPELSTDTLVQKMQIEDESVAPQAGGPPALVLQEQQDQPEEVVDVVFSGEKQQNKGGGKKNGAKAGLISRDTIKSLQSAIAVANGEKFGKGRNRKGNSSSTSKGGSGKSTANKTSTTTLDTAIDEAKAKLLRESENKELLKLKRDEDHDASACSSGAVVPGNEVGQTLRDILTQRTSNRNWRSGIAKRVLSFLKEQAAKREAGPKKRKFVIDVAELLHSIPPGGQGQGEVGCSSSLVEDHLHGKHETCSPSSTSTSLPLVCGRERIPYCTAKSHLPLTWCVRPAQDGSGALDLVPIFRSLVFQQAGTPDQVPRALMGDYKQYVCQDVEHEHQHDQAARGRAAGTSTSASRKPSRTGVQAQLRAPYTIEEAETLIRRRKLQRRREWLQMERLALRAGFTLSERGPPPGAGQVDQWTATHWGGNREDLDRGDEGDGFADDEADLCGWDDDKVKEEVELNKPEDEGGSTGSVVADAARLGAGGSNDKEREDLRDGKKSKKRRSTSSSGCSSTSDSDDGSTSSSSDGEPKTKSSKKRKKNTTRSEDEDDFSDSEEDGSSTRTSSQRGAQNKLNVKKRRKRNATTPSTSSSSTPASNDRLNLQDEDEDEELSLNLSPDSLSADIHAALARLKNQESNNTAEAIIKSESLSNRTAVSEFTKEEQRKQALAEKKKQAARSAKNKKTVITKADEKKIRLFAKLQSKLLKHIQSDSQRGQITPKELKLWMTEEKCSSEEQAIQIRNYLYEIASAEKDTSSGQLVFYLNAEHYDWDHEVVE